MLNHEALQAIQQDVSKTSLISLIIKDANPFFFYPVYPLVHFRNGDNDVIIDFRVDSMSLTSFKKRNVILT